MSITQHLYRNILTDDIFSVESYVMIPLNEKPSHINVDKLKVKVQYKSTYLLVYIYTNEDEGVYTDNPDFYHKSLVFNSTQSTLIVLTQEDFLGAVIDGGTCYQQYIFERVLED